MSIRQHDFTIERRLRQTLAAERLSTVSAAQVQAAARKYLAPEAALPVVIVPREPQPKKAQRRGEDGRTRARRQWRQRMIHGIDVAESLADEGPRAGIREHGNGRRNGESDQEREHRGVPPA